MREIERKRAISRAVVKGQKDATALIYKMLDRRYKVLKRELRRGNLRKRLAKAYHDHEPMLATLRHPTIDEQILLISKYRSELAQITGTELSKDDGGWVQWINSFSMDVRDSLKPIAFGVYDTEGKYWMNRGQSLDPLDADVIINRYEARTGRQITGIAEATRDKVLADITDWYNSDQSLPELIDTLGQYFSEDRARMIAETESQFIVSEVARDAMEQFGIKKFDVDLGTEACEECFAIADLNPHDLGDEMPPYHPKCDCGIKYVFEENT